VKILHTTMMFAEDNESDAAVNRFYYDKANTEVRATHEARLAQEQAEAAQREMERNLRTSPPPSTPSTVSNGPYGGYQGNREYTNGEITEIKKKIDRSDDIRAEVDAGKNPNDFVMNPNARQRAYDDFKEDLKQGASDVTKGIGDALDNILKGGLSGLSSTILLPALVIGGVYVLSQRR
jgi:hypothetical protein